MAGCGPSPVRRVWRVVCWRWWLAALFAMLAIDAMSIDNGKFDHSRAKRFIAGPPPRSTAHGRPLMGRALDTPEGLRWVWPWEPEYRTPNPAGSPWEQVTVFIDAPRRTGLYHLTTESRDIHVFPRSLSEDDRARLHRVLLAELTTDPETCASDYAAPIIEVLRTGGWSLTKAIPVGQRRNVTAGVLAFACVALLVGHAAAGLVRLVRRRTTPPPLTAA